MSTSIPHYINGKTVPSTSGKVADVFNPALGQVSSKVGLASIDEVNTAVAAAKAAFPAWAATTPLRRARVLFKFKELLDIHAEKLATIISSEHGKVVSDAIGEVTRGIEVVEFACGIPGSIGGAVFMNAGAYGGEIAHILQSCQILTKEGEIETLSVKDLAFGYRHSAIQDSGAVVLSAKFALAPGNHQVIKQEMDRLTHLRELKQPLEYPSCGSVFKRPEGHFTGKLIQDANLQGLKWGGAQISTKHAGFIVNIDNATATDYVELIKHIQETILKEFDVVLETEVRIIGREK